MEEGQDYFYFEGLNWRFTPHGPIPFCTRCDLQIHPQNYRIGQFDPGYVEYSCEHCNSKVTKTGQHAELVNLMLREAQRIDRARRKGPG
jgi:hypothetical protein